METHVITLFPEIFEALNYGLIGKAIENNIFSLYTHQLRDFATRKDRRIDDEPFGGKEGMVIQAEPIYLARQAIRQKSLIHNSLYLTPKGPLSSKNMPSNWQNLRASPLFADAMKA